MSTYPCIAYVVPYATFKGAVKPDDDMAAVMEHAASGLLEAMGEIPELAHLDIYVERPGVSWQEDAPVATYVFYLGEWQRVTG